MLRYLAISILAICLSGCAAHVTFFQPSAISDAPGETRVFLDARGDLYPQSGIAATYVLPSSAQGSLFEAARGADPALCRRAEAGSEMARLCAAVAQRCLGDDTDACFERWEGVQSELWHERGRAIAGRFSRDDDVTLALLIHGFNNWYRESNANYATAERQMRRFLSAGQRLHVIQVYWDGCRSNSAGIGCWGRAQSTGPLAGFALRQLFNGVATNWQARNEPHWRVLTHSSGAFVAGAIFGDPTAVLPQLINTSTNRWYARFDNYRTHVGGSYGAPQAVDIRLGMFAPATPDTTFTGSNDYPGGVLAPHLTILTVLQSEDSGPNKRFLGCQRIGNSCLGVSRVHACNMQRALAARQNPTPVTVYDFTRPAALWGDERTLHDYSVYARQAADYSTFFRDLFATAPRAGDAGSSAAGPLIVC